MMLESLQRSWHNVDSCKEEMAVITMKTYGRCQLYIGENREKIEKYCKPCKNFKKVIDGDRVFLKYIPNRNEKKILQPTFDERYKVTAKLSKFVDKARNLKTS